MTVYRYEYSGHCILLGNKKREWQDTEYVLSYFGRRVGEAGKRYIAYVEQGIGQGRRPQLAGGGLIRSLGGWSEVKKMRLIGQDRLKGDERILGESDLVLDVLSEAVITQGPMALVKFDAKYGIFQNRAKVVYTFFEMKDALNKPL